MSTNKRKNEGTSKGAPSIKKNKPTEKSEDIVLANVVFSSNNAKTNGVNNANNGNRNNTSKPTTKDVKMTEKSDSDSSSSSSSEDEKVPAAKNTNAPKSTPTPSKTQQTTSTKSAPQPAVKKTESSSSESSSDSSDEDMEVKSKPQVNAPKPVPVKAQPPVKSAVQKPSSQKKAESSSESSSSSSEDEKEQKPVAKTQPPVKTASKPNVPAKKADSSSEDSSSSEDEKEAISPKTIPSKIVSKPAPPKATTQTKSDSSDSSDSSSSESEKEEKKNVSKPPVKSSQSAPTKKAESDSSDSSSSEEEEEKKPTPAPSAPKSNGKSEPKKEETKVKTSSSATASAETVQYREQNNVTYEDIHRGEEFAPVRDFKEASTIFPSVIMKVTEKFTKPTPIQAQSWPIARSGRDIIAIAETGSGKTLSFGLPILAQILSKQNSTSGGKRTPLMLVLAPTRELAMQTADVCEAAGATCGLKTLCVYGGSPREGNVKALKAGVDLLIATPGRLIDLLQEGVAVLDKVQHLVLDEADRMLDMGFEPAIRQIIAAVPKTRQTLMFSATWPLSIQSLANEFLREPAKVTIGVKQEQSDGPTANRRVTQIVEVMTYRDKEHRLQDLLHKLHKSRKNRILVFALYKKEAERIEQTLRRKGWKVQGIHGDKSQALRSKAIESFRSGEEPLLVATDVAARGLDIPDVEYVINYTFPLTIEDYVHRIGRTGRAGKTGTAYTFFTDEDKTHAGELQQVLREANQDIPQDLMSYGAHVKKKEHALYGAHFKKLDTNQKATRTTFDE
uniref:RNA helicase n=1 Tax=Hordeum vulgare subsp. vulgare TaxID=112509 RepID=F2DST3_HORVV|nr:predicted protein [Hordeum vulgare subsp. vulgare]